MVVEPVCVKALDLTALVAGDGRPVLRVDHGWQALAAHLDAPVAITAAMLERLGRLDREQWVSIEAGDAPLQALMQLGLALACDDPREFAAVDARLRAGHWWGLSALAWQHGRWERQDSAASGASASLDRVDDLVAQFGLPPASACADVLSEAIVSLPDCPPTALEALVAGRITCRNFDPDGRLTLEQLAAMLWRSLAQRGVVEDISGACFAKKAVPSAGGLHPTEAYLLVRAVDGLEDGAYHYQPDRHCLVPHPLHGNDSLAARARSWLAGQYWFADAQVLLVLASRHARLQWKYRAHSKAWRAAILDVGHISQALYLAGTELGLGIFVTAAINEIDIGLGLGLPAYTDAPLAIVGIGVRGLEQKTAEFDPAGAIWQPAGE